MVKAKEYKIGVLLPGRELYDHPKGLHELHAVTDLTYRSLLTGEPQIMDAADHRRLADANVTIKVIADSGASSMSAMNKSDSDLYDMEVAWWRAVNIMPKVDALLVADHSDAGEVMLRAASHYGMSNMAVSTSMAFANKEFFPYTCRAVQSMKGYHIGFAKLFRYMEWKRFASIGLGVAWQVEQMRADVGSLMEALLDELPNMEYPLERYAQMKKWPRVDDQALTVLESSVQEVKARRYRIFFIACPSPLCSSEIAKAMQNADMDRAPFISLWQDAKLMPKSKWDGMFSFEAEQNRIPDASNSKQADLKSAFRNYGPGSAFPYILNETWDIWNHGWKIKRKTAVNHSTTPLTNPMPYIIHDSIWAMALGFAKLEELRASGQWHPGSDVNANDANGVSALPWAMKNVSFQGASGPIKFDQNCEALGKIMLMNTKGGRLKQVGELSLVRNSLEVALPCDRDLRSALAYLHERNISEVGKACLAFPVNFSGTYLPADKPPACPAGTVQNGSSMDQMNICQQCPAGFYAPAIRHGSYDVLLECLPCPYGYYQDEAGQGQCKLCPAGTSQNETGQAFCSSCLPGKYAPSAGNWECFECQVGRSTNGLQGQPDCFSCPEGGYADDLGMSSCKQCPVSMTTSEKGAISESACGCPPGNYEVGEEREGTLHDSQRQCNACLEGVECTGFGSFPLVQAGYFMHPEASRSSQELHLWKCTSAKSCPGQSGNVTDAICAPNMVGLNCGLCQPGYYRSGQHECQECSDNHWTGPFVFLAFFLICGAFHYAWHRHSSHVEATENLLGSITLGVTLSFFQSLGVFDTLNFSWPQIFQSLLDVLKVLFFDLSVLGPDCVLTPGLASSYLMPMSLPLVIAGTFLSWYLLSRSLHFLSRSKFPAFEFSGIVNSTGLITQAIYISICATTVSMLDCYESSVTGTSRVIRSRPYAVCWSAEYKSMVPLIVLGIIFYVVGIFAVFTWAVAVAPSQYVNAQFRTKIKFLVFKYRPNTWWYGIIYMIRALALSMVSVIFPDDAFQQFLLMLTIFVFALCVHLKLMPLADGLSNNMEAFEICLLIAVLGLGSYFMTDRDFSGQEKQTATTIGVLMMVCVAACGFALSCVFAWSVFLAQFPQAKRRMHRQTVDEVLPRLSMVCSILVATPHDQLEDLMHNATYIDRWHVCEMVNFLLLETHGLLPENLWERRLPKVTGKIERSITREEIRKNLETDFERVRSSASFMTSHSSPSNNLPLCTDCSSWPSILSSRALAGASKALSHVEKQPGALASSKGQHTSVDWDVEAQTESKPDDDVSSEARHAADTWDLEAARPLELPQASSPHSITQTTQAADEQGCLETCI